MSVRITIGRTVALAAFALSLVSASPAQAAEWSPPCTPDLIHVYSYRLSTRCQENGKWYHIEFAAHATGHVDRIARMVHAVQLSGKKILFHDVSGSSPTERNYDMIALPK
jgi:hypothetical protein